MSVGVRRRGRRACRPTGVPVRGWDVVRRRAFSEGSHVPQQRVQHAGEARLPRWSSAEVRLGRPQGPARSRVRHQSAGFTFHAVGRSLPQKTQTKSSSRTIECSWQSGQRRNTTAWVKPDGRPSLTQSRAWATAGHELVSGQYPVEWLLTSPTTHRPAWRLNPTSPALRTDPPPAQATCSLRRGASRSMPSMSTTKVNGSTSSAADRSEIQLLKSAAEPIRQPPLPGRTAAFRSAGPTYR